MEEIPYSPRTLLIVSILNFVRIKRRTTVPYYDERQIKARGDAFKYAFFTLLTTLIADGIISKANDGIVVLGTGNIEKALTVKAVRFTKGAQEKIA